MVVTVALNLRCEYVPLPLVRAPVGGVQLDRDPGLGLHQIINQSSSADTHSGGGVRATSPHVEVDVVAGVVAAQMSCLVPEVLSYGNLSLTARYLVVLPAE